MLNIIAAQAADILLKDIKTEFITCNTARQLLIEQYMRAWKDKMGKLQFLILHCTATPEGREVSSSEIRAWHTDPVCRGGRGWKQVGYTDMIHLDGMVERLVDNNEDAEVDPWEITNGVAGVNSVSRHVVYVGGVSSDGKPKDTRTKAQLAAMEAYVKNFHKRFPEARIAGHNEFACKACPSFNVKEWLINIGIYQINEKEWLQQARY